MDMRECGVICMRKMSYMLDKGNNAEQERISAEVGQKRGCIFGR